MKKVSSRQQKHVIIQHAEVRALISCCIITLSGLTLAQNFVTANTLAKSKKLEPNEIEFSQSSINKLSCI